MKICASYKLQAIYIYMKDIHERYTSYIQATYKLCTSYIPERYTKTEAWPFQNALSICPVQIGQSIETTVWNDCIYLG